MFSAIPRYLTVGIISGPSTCQATPDRAMILVLLERREQGRLAERGIDSLPPRSSSRPSLSNPTRIMTGAWPPVWRRVFSRCFASLIPSSPLPARAICSREAINFLEGRCCLFMHSGVFPRLAHRAEMHAPFMYVDHRIYHGHSCGLACWASQTYASKETQYAQRKKHGPKLNFGLAVRNG